MNDLFVEGAIEAFDDSVGFRLADEGEAGGEAVEAALALEVVGQILGAVIVAQFDAAGDIAGGLTGKCASPLGPPAHKRQSDRRACRRDGRGIRRSSARRRQRATASLGRRSTLSSHRVAQRMLGASVVMRPSWALAATGMERCGESKWCLRIRRSIRLRPTRDVFGRKASARRPCGGLRPGRAWRRDRRGSGANKAASSSAVFGSRLPATVAFARAGLTAE